MTTLNLMTSFVNTTGSAIHTRQWRAPPRSRQDLGPPNFSSPSPITLVPPNHQARPVTQQQETTTRATLTNQNVSQRKPGRGRGRPPGSKNKNDQSRLKESQQNQKRLTLEQNIDKMAGVFRDASVVLGSMKKDLVPKFAEEDKKIKQLEKEVKELKEKVNQHDQKLKELQDPIRNSETKIRRSKDEGEELNNKIEEFERQEDEKEEQNCISDDDNDKDIEDSKEASDASDSEIESLNETREGHESVNKRLKQAGTEPEKWIEGLLALVLGIQSSNIKQGTSSHELKKYEYRTESNKLAGDKGTKRKKSASSEDEAEST